MHFGSGAPDDDQEGQEYFADTFGAEEGDDRVHQAVGAAPAHPGPFVDVDAFAELSDRVYTSSAAERSVHAALFERIRAVTGCLASAAAKSVAANDMLSGWVSTNWRCALPSANTYSAWSAVLDAAVPPYCWVDNCGRGRWPPLHCFGERSACSQQQSAG